MKIKSYFVDSVASAMDKARVELGTDAVLISSRPTEASLNDLGAYEVVFGIETAATAMKAQTSKESPLTVMAPVEETGPDRILRELFALRRQIEHLRDHADDLPFSKPPSQSAPDFGFLETYLTREGFSAEIAAELTEAVAHRSPQPFQGERTAHAGERFAQELAGALLLEEIGARLEVTPTLLSHDNHATVLLVGAPGAGKTASLMKLALQYGLKQRRHVHLFSTDTLRIGGWEPLSAFARIGGLDFEPVQHFSFLKRAVADRAGNGLTLIDTPGLSSGTEAEMEELARATAGMDVDVHLVLPATLSNVAAARQLRNFERFRPAKLLLTHTDEIEQVGPILDVCLRSRLPLSFLACGQQIPEDIREADKTALMSQLGSPFRAISVAA